MIGRESIAALVILAVSAVLFALTLGLPTSAFVPIGPGFYPRIVLGLAAALALALLVSDVAMQRRGRERQPAVRRNYRRVALLFGIFGLYVAALPTLGFRVATFLFVTLAQVALDPPHGRRRWLVVLAVALGTTLLTYFVFERHLSVLLPRGRWTGF